MRTSEQAKLKIGEFEGLKLEAYKCPAGVWTIGYGHTKGVKQGAKITKEQALQFLTEDLTEAEATVNARFPGISQNRFDALVDFVFNLGAAKFNTSTLYRKIKLNPEDLTIRAEFNRWVYGNGKVLPGLVTRRAWEANLYFS